MKIAKRSTPLISLLGRRPPTTSASAETARLTSEVAALKEKLKAAIKKPLPTEEPPQVYIIIPVYGAFEETSNCLTSLWPTLSKQHKVILVDDGNSDKRITDLLKGEAARHNAIYLANPTNMGFVAAVNLGLSTAITGDVILLNTDTLVSLGWVESLLECTNSSDMVGFCSPLSNNAWFQTLPSEIHDQDTLDRVNRRLQKYKKDYLRTNAVIGFCILMTRKALEFAGHLDTLFAPGYGEELDWCFRVSKRYHGLIDTHCLVWHKRSASFGQDSSALQRKGMSKLGTRHPVETKNFTVNCRVVREKIMQMFGQSPITAPDLENPLISVVMPTKNGGKYIYQTVRSIIEQTYEDWELLVLIDARTKDNTQAEVLRAAGKDPRVKIFSEEAVNLPEAINRGLHKVNGQLFTWASDDNTYYPTAFEKMLGALTSTKSALVYTDFEYINQNGDVRISPAIPIDYSFDLLKRRNILGNCFLASTPLVHEVGWFNVNWFLVEDWEFYLRAGERFKITKVPEVLYKHRQHQTSLSVEYRKDVIIASRKLMQEWYCRNKVSDCCAEEVPTFSLTSTAPADTFAISFRLKELGSTSFKFQPLS